MNKEEQIKRRLTKQKKKLLEESAINFIKRIYLMESERELKEEVKLIREVLREIVCYKTKQ